jgi:hypothetical protein
MAIKQHDLIKINNNLHFNINYLKIFIYNIVNFINFSINRHCKIIHLECSAKYLKSNRNLIIKKIEIY